jgi:hypothetical protein
MVEMSATSLGVSPSVRSLRTLYAAAVGFAAVMVVAWLSLTGPTVSLWMSLLLMCSLLAVYAVVVVAAGSVPGGAVVVVPVGSTVGLSAGCCAVLLVLAFSVSPAVAACVAAVLMVVSLSAFRRHMLAGQARLECRSRCGVVQIVGFSPRTGDVLVDLVAELGSLVPGLVTVEVDVEAFGDEERVAALFQLDDWFTDGSPLRLDMRGASCSVGDDVFSVKVRPVGRRPVSPVRGE